MRWTLNKIINCFLSIENLLFPEKLLDSLSENFPHVYLKNFDLEHGRIIKLVLKSEKMPFFVKIKLPRYGEITLFFTDICKSCPSCEFKCHKYVF